MNVGYTKTLFATEAHPHTSPDVFGTVFPGGFFLASADKIVMYPSHHLLYLLVHRRALLPT